ncbi:hypothetical protein NIES22_61340 [Calothrix brevissima NIES-22]|nr:hypothetical protein NIES22_61340 [Calothrix brevissima NIES-22]
MHRKFKKYWILAVVSLSLTFILFIPVRLAIAFHQAPRPQAILTLGAWIDREEFSAELAQWYPKLEIWVSSGSPPQMARKIFHDAGIPDRRFHLDYRAVDTVTNFTTLVSDFKEHNIQHLFLITSNNHMPRAKAIAFLVLGSQGIAFTPLSVPSDKPKESRLRILRDIARSLLWIVTGHTGTNFY